MLSLALLLFLIMDPFGNLVTLNTLLGQHSPGKRRAIVLRESAIAAGILLLMALVGGVFLKTLGLEEHALRISGGIVLFLIALGLLFPSKSVIVESVEESPLIVPIAMPLIAGPSAISMVVLSSETHPIPTVCGAVLIASLGSVALLAASPSLFRFLGERGANALERLMGMLLVMISIQMILDGIDTYLTARG